jgi:hypothetical protein
MKTILKIFVLVFLTLSVTTLTSCKKPEPPTVITAEVTAITTNSAIAGGEVTADGNADITARGVCYSRANAMPTIDDDKTTNGTGSGAFTSTLSGLLNGSSYFVRAYATNEAGTSYGAVKEFTTTQ